MSTTVTTQQAETVCNDLLNLLATFKQQLGKIADDSGLTMMQLFALRAIAEGNNATGKIAQMLHCDASNVTGIVDRLVTLELATRQEDARDRRVKTVQLTHKGQALIHTALASLPNRLSCTSLSQQEASDLHTITAKLTQTA